MIAFADFQYHPVIHLPPDYEVYDFTAFYRPDRPLRTAYGIGRYDEKRVGMYTAAQYQDPSGARDIHVGIDIAAPVGTPVHAFFAGEVFLFGNNDREGDYGYTLITRHRLGRHELFALHGHLSARSVEGKRVSQPFAAGDVIAWVGDRHENGGWNPHLHFQLCVEEPKVCDMPGAVSDRQRAEALRRYPDPRLVLGPLY